MASQISSKNEFEMKSQSNSEKKDNLSDATRYLFRNAKIYQALCGSLTAFIIVVIVIISFIAISLLFGVLVDDKPDQEEIETKTPLSTVIPQSTIETPKECPDTWKQFRNKCYKLSDNMTLFNEGEQICQAWGGHLTSINSKEENDFVADLFDEDHRDTIQPQNTWYRIGSISGDVPNFRWLDGSPFNYTNWNTNRNFPTPHYTNKNLLFAAHPSTKSATKQWANFYDDSRFNVCSYVLI